MQNLLLKTLSPQAAQVYALLLKYPQLSAKQIGKHLGIVENTVYRDLKELSRLGLASALGGYPVKFQAKPAEESVALLTGVFRQNFYETFGLHNEGENNIKMSFFQTRDELLKLFVKDAKNAKKKINIIISGHEVPAETVLSQKRAIEHGVKIRKLIQGLNAEQQRMAKSWQKIGVEVKYTPNINARIIIFDGQITHFGSYSPEHHKESVGVRFDYPPLAKLMDEMFEQKWQAGKII